ncbi:DHH family phosphoesterase [Lentimicrobium sp.]
MSKFSQHALVELKSLLHSSAPIVITTHYNPDGDALGASLAWFQFLQNRGKNVSLIVPNDFPDFLAWMPGADKALIFFHHRQQAERLLKEAKLIFCLDFNVFSRVELFTKELAQATAAKVLIDHHPDPDSTFDVTFSVKETSSTAELIFDLINELGSTQEITQPIAECLYVGIMTDTGSFSYACNYPETYLAIACLVEQGVDCEAIHRLVYDTYAESRMRLLGFCLSERMVVLDEFATAYIWLSMDDLDRFNFKPGDTEGVVNYALSIKGIVFAALFTEKEDKVRISFRSKGDFKVNEFAKTLYNGGGHKNASGGDAFLPLAETLKQFESVLSEYKTKLLETSGQTAYRNN